MIFIKDKVKNKEKDIYETYGLENVNLSALASQNLIIGKNGSGKTRFLKALEQDKKRQKKDNEEVITLYFPEIQTWYGGAEREKKQETEVYPYDLLKGSETLDFKDFLKIMEEDNGQFLFTILQIAQVVRTKENQNAINTIKVLNEFLMDYCWKKIEIRADSKKIIITQYDENKPLRRLEYTDALREFSPGELLLFYLCVFLSVIKARSSRKLVILMDEPELHLHSRVLVKFIKMLREIDCVAELWVASHSLFLVPLFAFEEIVFFDRGTMVKKNSRIYKELYNTLVGVENINLFEFLKSIDDWEYYQFIAECFCLPKPVSRVNINDEQFLKLMDAISHIKDKEKIQVLDYGAGECRIGECMKLLADSGEKMLNVVYSAFEPYPGEELLLKKGKGFKLYTDFDQVIKENTLYDVVVLMNVLHEVPVTKWKKTFSNIARILNDGGILVLLEVQALTSGEQPYGDNGYLVLHDEQVRLLFGNHRILNINAASENKSNCWIIPRGVLRYFSEDTIKKAVGSLYSRSNEELEACYRKRIEMAHSKASKQECCIAARKYAFLSQQFLNAQFALKSLGEEPQTWLKYMPDEEGVNKSYVSEDDKIRVVDVPSSSD